VAIVPAKVPDDQTMKLTLLGFMHYNILYARSAVIFLHGLLWNVFYVFFSDSHVQLNCFGDSNALFTSMVGHFI